MKHGKLGLWMLITLVTGNMIGSGIFLLPSSLAGIGSISLYSWLFTAAGALSLAFVFSRLSSQYPKTGGPYAYAYLGLGKFIGFQTAYAYWVGIWVGNAAIVIAFVGYLRVFWPALVDPLGSSLVAIAVVWFLTFVNIMGVRQVGFLQIVTTVLKLIPILLIATIGWHYVNPTYYTMDYNVTSPPQSSFSAISMGAALTFWAFVGLESATVPAESVLNPKRNIPLATIIGVSIAATTYISSSLAIMGILPTSILQQSTSPFADAAQIIFGPWGRSLIAIGAMVSCFGCLNGWILLQGQIPMAAAKDKLFPTVFSQCNSRGIPAKGLIITSTFITALLLLTASKHLVKQFEITILLATLAILIPYFYSAIVEVVLLKKEGRHSIKAYLRLLVAVFAAVFSFWAMASSGENNIYYGALLLLSSVPLYAWIKRRK